VGAGNRRLDPGERFFHAPAEVIGKALAPLIFSGLVHVFVGRRSLAGSPGTPSEASDGWRMDWKCRF